MTRHLESGGHRNLIGLKVSDDLWNLIHAARGDMPLQDYLRGLISCAAQRPGGWTDWERRARDAERRLEQVRSALE